MELVELASVASTLNIAMDIIVSTRMIVDRVLTDKMIGIQQDNCIDATVNPCLSLSLLILAGLCWKWASTRYISSEIITGLIPKSML